MKTKYLSLAAEVVALARLLYVDNLPHERQAHCFAESHAVLHLTGHVLLPKFYYLLRIYYLY